MAIAVFPLVVSSELLEHGEQRIVCSQRTTDEVAQAFRRDLVRNIAGQALPFALLLLGPWTARVKQQSRLAGGSETRFSQLSISGA